MSIIIGKYCGVARRDTYIYPKQIEGYTTPEPQILTTDGQNFTFKYTPIDYTVSYNLNGGEFDISDNPRSTYNIETDYIPPVPHKEGYTFIGWSPNAIKPGFTGNMTFTANWSDNAILLPGATLNSTISAAYDKTTIMAIKISSTRPDVSTINLSSTNTPIQAWYSNGTLFFYSTVNICCNQDMSSAFEGFELLRDIEDLSRFTTKSNMKITNLIKDCRLLGDISAVEDWADGVFSDFTDAFTNTPALDAGRVPSWYSWTVVVHYISSTGRTIETVNTTCIPGQTLYAKNITAYNADTQSVVITSKDLEYSLTYIPVNYLISYDTDGGTIPSSAKTSYTIEDGAYTPPEAVKSGYRFVKWNPERIENGDYGNIRFIANYVSE